jgi:hypothetical protein
MSSTPSLGVLALRPKQGRELELGVLVAAWRVDPDGLSSALIPGSASAGSAWTRNGRARPHPWHTEIQPSTADMAAKLRRVSIAAGLEVAHPDEPTPKEISVLC